MLPLHRIRFVLPMLAALLTASVSPALAQPAQARSYLEARHEEAKAVLQQPAGASRTARLTELLNGLLDYNALAQASLGDHWGGQDEAARAEFVSLLKQLVERSYQANLERTLSFEVEYESARARGEDVRVTTMARSRTNRRAPPVSIDYTMRREGRSWRVVDIITDGQSLVEGYRAQFNRIISRDGWDGLLSRMRRRLEG